MNQVSDILITHEPISESTLHKYCTMWFGNMVKVVIDIQTGEIALGGALHADGEALLLNRGSLPENLWGANIYPENKPGHQIEYTALINIRPHQNNTSMHIQDETVKNKVHKVIQKLVPIAAQ